MLGYKDRDQGELFITGSLRQLLPNDHILVRVDRVLDLSWLRGEVADLYCADNGRPGIDPEASLRLMLAGFLLGIVHDRRLLREAQVNLAIRWFAGYGLIEGVGKQSVNNRTAKIGVKRKAPLAFETLKDGLALRLKRMPRFLVPAQRSNGEPWRHLPESAARISSDATEALARRSGEDAV